MAAPAEARAKLDAVGIDRVCELIEDGHSLTGIARTVGAGIGTLLSWLAADVERSARAREARARTAKLWDERAAEVIEQAADPFELSKAKELAHHFRWRAKAIAPKEYGDKLAVHGSDELPPVKTETTLAPGEAYKRLLGGES